MIRLCYHGLQPPKVASNLGYPASMIQLHTPKTGHREYVHQTESLKRGRNYRRTKQVLEDIGSFNSIDINKYVYHYTRAETAILSILPSGRLRFSPFSDVNDPRESRDWQICLGGDASDHPELIFVLNNEVNAAAKHNARLLCMSRDQECTGPQSTSEFYRGFGRPRMWAQYGDNHKGICLVFDRDRLDSKIREQLGASGITISGPVLYSNYARREFDALLVHVKQLKGIDIRKFANDHVQRHIEAFFLQKSMDWSQEAEVRWVRFGGKPGVEHVAFGDSLVAIIRGTSHRNTSQSAALLRETGVRIYQMAWTNGFPAALEIMHSR